jgi:hypothetical protein
MPQRPHHRQTSAWPRKVRILRDFSQREESHARHSHACRYAGFLMQIFAVPALVLHCHCALNAVLANGFGRVNLTDRKAATQASVRMVAISAISWRVHKVQVMAFTPLALVGE